MSVPNTSSSALTRPSIPPSHATLLTALSRAVTIRHFKQIHAQILRSRPDRPDTLFFKLILSSATVSLRYAVSVFSDSSLCSHPRISSQLFRHFSRSSKPSETFWFYQKVRSEGLRGVDPFSFPPLLKAASRVSGLAEGMEIHGVAEKVGFGSDRFVQTGLLSLYVACDKISDARLLFDGMLQRDVVSWSIMIDGYCRSGFIGDAFKLFEEMANSDVKPDQIILSVIISASCRAGSLSYGKAVHDYIIQNKVTMDAHLWSSLVGIYANHGHMDMAERLYHEMSHKNLIVSTAMISGYLKSGRIDEARSVFNEVDDKDLVCWSTMISGYAESDCPQEGIKLFNELRISGARPDQATMLSVISACAHLGALDQAKLIQESINQTVYCEALPINNAVIDMYAKCGTLEEAIKVFERMPTKNVISWSSVINAFAMHGDARKALEYFYRMEEGNVEPNSVTFVGVLYACSHAGLVEEGKKIFSLMSEKYNMAPKLEHYGCMVDLYGRSNLLSEALETVKTMAVPPNVVIWGSLMSACRAHGDTELAEFAAKRLLELDPGHDGALVLLSNIYASERRWDRVMDIRARMKQRGVFKEKGFSRITLNGEIHEFLVSDRRHKQCDQIYLKLGEVVSELKRSGYNPASSSVSMDLDEEDKKELLLWHSEKLALCYGLMNVEEGACIRIVKNLRVCEDCHSFLKLASKVYGREIVMRDRTRFHHFRGGRCSCNDFW